MVKGIRIILIAGFPPMVFLQFLVMGKKGLMKAGNTLEKQIEFWTHCSLPPGRMF